MGFVTRVLITVDSISNSVCLLMHTTVDNFIRVE